MEAALTEDEVSSLCAVYHLLVVGASCVPWVEKEREVRPRPAPLARKPPRFFFFQQAGVGGSVGPTGPDALAWGPPPGPIPRTIIPPLYVPLMSNPASLFFSGFANQLPNKHPLGQTDDSNTPPSALHFLPSFDWIGIFSDCAPPPHSSSSPLLLSRSPSGTARRTIRPSVPRPSILPPVAAEEMPPPP